jgi:IstB-like ATP binding protein
LSIILTTNRSLASWGEIFEDEVVAAATLNRLLDNAVGINIRGPSYHMRKHRTLVEEAQKRMVAASQPSLCCVPVSDRGSLAFSEAAFGR